MVLSGLVERRERPAALEVALTPGRSSHLRALVSFHPGLVVVAIACAALVRQAMHAGLAGDVFYEVASGRWMLTHHAILRRDVFTYSVRGKAWLDEEWGFQVLLAWLVAHLGPVSYWLVSGGACAGAVVAGVALWRRSGAGWLWTAALSVLAAAGLSVGLDPRPQDLSYLLFSLLLLFLSLARRRAAWLLAVPPLIVVWANIHGSFLLGLATLALELAWSLLPARARRLHLRALASRLTAFCLGASVLATFVNPSGPRLVAYALKVSTSSQLTSFISEWQSPNFHSPLMLAVVAGPVLLLLGIVLLSDAKLGLAEVVLALGLFLATLHAVRFAPYFDVAACAALARWQPVRRETLPSNVLSAPAAVVLAVALLAGAHVPAGAVQVSGPLGTPVAATDFLSQQSGRIFTTYWWGDYLDYRGLPVFVDGRTDLYFGTGVLPTYLKVAQLEVEPDAFFSRWGIRWVMWGQDAALSTYLGHDRGWVKVLTAQGAVVYEHKGRW